MMKSDKEALRSLQREEVDLTYKLNKLVQFTRSSNFTKVSDKQQVLLKKQVKAMTLYQQILDERINDLIHKIRYNY